MATKEKQRPKRPCVDFIVLGDGYEVWTNQDDFSSIRLKLSNCITHKKIEVKLTLKQAEKVREMLLGQNGD